MDEPKSLDSLFKEKILRIPDYQRGYAWQRGQLKDFWEDLINLSSGRSHYTGVITLKEIEKRKIQETDNEYWLVDEDSYKVYHIVDGQQRLTTFVIFVQAFLDLYKSVPGTQNLADDKIFVSENLTVAAVQDKFLFKRKPSGSQYRTYKFGYTADNPSDEYLRYRILNEQGAGHLQETFYTLNLSNAKIYLLQQLQDYKAREGAQAVTNLYKKLTKQFLFNEYIIRDEFDVFVAFETINNRGKRLSDLELLKNRLIYLTTLFKEQDFAPADRDYLRDTVNKGWKEVYYQLGRNKERPLNDDDFLRAHWTMYFQYSRQTGKDYIRFLLEEKFAPKNIYKVVEENVSLLTAEEQTTADDFNNLENDTAEENEAELKVSAELRPTDLGDFVSSLKESACHWFNSFNPDKAQELSQAEGAWLVRLNRIGMVYFRPLVMAVLKNEKNEGKRIEIFRKMERFIFIAFRLTPARANYRSSEFYNAARYLDRGEIDADDILKKLDDGLSYVMDKNGTLKIAEFYDLITKKFTVGSGYYGWSGLRYFLYEYELSLLSESRQPKVEWNELLKTEKDKVSIEHIYPQTETTEWASHFDGLSGEDRRYYAGSLGNLLLLSRSINSALQNESFLDKKSVRQNAEGQKIRNGYSDGSHSEIEVSQEPKWGPEQIRKRGLRLLRFMEKRWEFRFQNDEEREKLLFLPASKNVIADRLTSSAATTATQLPPKPDPNTYWVVPGKLLAGEYPGARDPEEARRRLRRFLAVGVRHFIDLTETGELEPYAELLAEEAGAGTSYQRIPIRDESVPEEPETMAEIVAAIDRAMAEGGITYVHCWGGVGRTGLAVACWLQEGGQTPDEALTDLADKWRSCAKSQRRPRSPETAEQVRWVKKWPVCRSMLKFSK